MNPRLALHERVRLGIQIYIGWLAVIPVYLLVAALLRFRGKYKVNDVAGVRRQFRAAAADRSPLIICANHLTLIDSVLMMWAFASLPTYARKYRLLAWNLPAMENTKKRKSWVILTYLAKCILLDRMGEGAHTAGAIDKLTWLLNRGEIAMLFPEGTRSRTGRINPQAVNYGIGKILQRLPSCRVLCVYLRGRGQQACSDFPTKGDTLDILMEVVSPKTTSRGLRGVSDLSRQVIAKLESMEGAYFEKHLDEKARAA